MNSATASKVHPGPTFRGGLNVRTAGVGGGDGGGGVCAWVGRRMEEGSGRSGLCGHGWCVWVGGGREEEGGMGREGLVMQDLFCLSHI